jgi:predicted CopG family antitoxin
MASDRTLKVSDLTYERVHGLKRGNESVDDVLRRELGLVSDDYDIENDLGAYLTSTQREWASTIAEQIDELADFEHKIEREASPSGGDELRFVVPGEGVSVARMNFSERGFNAQYRDKSGDWAFCFNTITNPENDDLEQLLNETKQKVEGALRKWSHT